MFRYVLNRKAEASAEVFAFQTKISRTRALFIFYHGNKVEMLVYVSYMKKHVA